MTGSLIKTFDDWFVQDLFNSPQLVFAAKSDVAEIQILNKIIKKIEKEVKSQMNRFWGW